MGEKLYLRIVEEKDMKLLFDWRNDELVRKNSFSMDPIQWQEHIKWFNATLEKSYVLFFMMMCGGQAVGQIRIVLEEDNVASISYSIAGEFRGLGYGRYILHLVENEIYKRFNNRYILKALVKEDNLASQRSFERLGYLLQNREKDIFRTYIKML
ncbi:GNAT family N-acetyltransferase [Phascolarctobacterium sp.]|uniref:GNAT family N-acetyltransferase n=1 Tax=Phascolarctobacterium sp. TaxID=2049039 RepID=UPI0030784FA0